jgi:hypothetical protein
MHKNEVSITMTVFQFPVPQRSFIWSKPFLYIKELFSFTTLNAFQPYDVLQNTMNPFCHLVNNLVKLHKMIMLVKAEGNFPHTR